MIDEQDTTEWWVFYCANCDEETLVGKPEEQSLEDFGKFAAFMYGDPPMCTTCQLARRVA